MWARVCVWHDRMCTCQPSQGWVDPIDGQLYSSIDLPQPVDTWAPSRSSSVTWWLRRCSNKSLVILLGICSCHMLKEMEPTSSNKKRNWRATGVLSLVYGIWRILRTDYASKVSIQYLAIFVRKCSLPRTWSSLELLCVCLYVCVLLCVCLYVSVFLCLCVSVFVCLSWDRRLQFAEHALITWESTRSVAEFNRQTSAASHTWRLGEQVPLHTHSHTELFYWPFSMILSCLRCFDTARLASGRASGL